MTDDVGNIEIPKWDPALAALVAEEYGKRKNPLRLADFLALAQQHAIRFDDIMVTVFELCLQGEWSYVNRKGQARVLNREQIDKLYVNGRLHESDLRDFDGGWLPAQR